MCKNNKILCLSLRQYPDGYSSDHYHREARKGEMADTIEVLKEQIKVIRGKVGNSTMPETMTNTKFLSAEGKKYILAENGYEPVPAPKVFYEWERFLKAFDLRGEYADINTAMMIVLENGLSDLIKRLIDEGRVLYKYEITYLQSCWTRERKEMEEDICEMEKAVEKKKLALSELTLEKYLEMTSGDYLDMFGEEVFSDAPVIQLAVA
ncbi:MAG: hypothetical protein C4560_02570 [Nitrospiraceae bacterium]|nr:MAG: hypothetical protein C4560_02570 [Nitrospiraceae bacterium]